MKATLEIDGQTFELQLVQVGATWTVEVDGESFAANLAPNGSGSIVTVGKQAIHVQVGATHANIDGALLAYRIHAVSGLDGRAGDTTEHVTHVRPPMNGKLERLAVAVGQEVARGDVLFILEAMKMQNEVRSPGAGRVAAIHVAVGATLEPKQVVLDLEPL